jgi:hypothetical protein
MRYVIAGYSIVLAILFFYGVQLAWRRRRLVKAAQRVQAFEATVDDGRVGP